MNNNEIIDQIKNSLDIADIIGEKTKLRKTSRGFMGLCPFHQEDTPSFYIYTDSQTYYCFGCHEAGNIFSYVMKSENLEFRDALKLLADRAGIKLPSYHREEANIYSVLDLAAKFFTENLTGSSGAAPTAYLARRNLDTSDISKFSLGYSPNSWQALADFLRGKGIQDKAILDAGLALKNSRGIYDRFRGRIMFPIRDITGKIIAFGGRIIDGEGAKYINSPENSVYTKRRNLYLIDIARNAIREKRRSILVEGYMDAIRLHKSGFTETVASLGTSLTPEQAKMLSRYSDLCYICYDADTPGINAAVKNMYILAENGLSVYVIDIPDGKDPDEFLCNNPPEKFEALITAAKPLIIKHLEFLRPALENKSSRRKALHELLDCLRKLDFDDVLQCLGSICDVTGLPGDFVKNYLLSKDTSNTLPPQTSPRKKIISHSTKPFDDLDAQMCAILKRSKKCRLSFSTQEAQTLLKTTIAQNIACSILNNPPESLDTLWLQLNDTDKISLVCYGEFLCSQLPMTNDAEIFTMLYVKLQLRYIEKSIAALQSVPPDKRTDEIKHSLKNLFAQRLFYADVNAKKPYRVSRTAH